MAAFDDLVASRPYQQADATDFQGTTISLTNPGTVGTMASMPRLVSVRAHHRGGCDGLSAEYRGVRPRPSCRWASVR